MQTSTMALFDCIIYLNILILAGWARASETLAISNISSSSISSGSFLNLILTGPFLVDYQYIMTETQKIFKAEKMQKYLHQKEKCDKMLTGKDYEERILRKNNRRTHKAYR